MVKRRYPTVIPTTEIYRQMIKCQAACPVLTDARGYVTALARGELELGYQIAHDPNPLSTICGRICGAPCEDACRRSEIGPDHQPVAIRPLKRVLTERFGPESYLRLPLKKNKGDLKKEKTPGKPGFDFSTPSWSRQNLKVLAAQPNRKKGRIAVIGAGPSSLSAAHDLALLRHEVIIYEAGPKSGGMMRYGVPIYRMDWEAMDQEVQSIIDLGVEIQYNTRIGEDIPLKQLRQEYDAIYLGIGLMQGRQINIEGSNLDGVIPAIDLLLNYNLGYRVDLGQRVIVVGGGDVAMDAARTALRLGVATSEQDKVLSETQARLDDEAETVRTAFDVARTALRLGVADVRVIALESWEELPASEFEIEEALEEGIKVYPRLGPIRIIGKNNEVIGLEIIDVASVFDEAGRFSPRYIPGTNRIWDCDNVILAIGQSADLTALQGADDVEKTSRGLVAINPHTGQTSAGDIFAGGDVAHGPRLIIHAVKDGHIAALGIEEFIQGRNIVSDLIMRWEEIPGHRMPENWTKYQRTLVPSLPVDRRTGLTQTELGYTEDQARVQALRCLECSINTIFDSSKCILCNGCVDVCPWNCLKIVRIDSLEGKGLPSLVDSFISKPQNYWETEKTPTAAAMIKDDSACTRCALCVERCPTGAITMEKFRFDEHLSYKAES